MAQQFMQDSITEKTNWVLVADQYEENWVEKCYYSDDMGEIVEEKTGYGARLSAPGYLDCTDWMVFDSIEEAQNYLHDTFHDDHHEDGCDACDKLLEDGDCGCWECENKAMAYSEQTAYSEEIPF